MSYLIELWQYIKNLLLSTSEITLPIAAIFVSVMIHKCRFRGNLTEQKYKSLIFPLFNTLEPHLYCQLSPAVHEALNTLVKDYNKNKAYSSIELNEVMRSCFPFEHCSQENYISLCKIIDKEYDKCCSLLGIKRRSIRYRLLHRQYQNKLKTVAMALFYIIRDCLLMLLVCIAVVLLLGFVVRFLHS